MLKSKEVLLSAKSIIENKDNWTHHCFHNDNRTAHCAIGAINVVLDQGFSNEDIMFYVKIHQFLDYWSKQLYPEKPSIISVNDDLGHEAVLNVFDYAINDLSSLES